MDKKDNATDDTENNLSQTSTPKASDTGANEDISSQTAIAEDANAEKMAKCDTETDKDDEQSIVGAASCLCITEMSPDDTSGTPISEETYGAAAATVTGQKLITPQNKTEEPFEHTVDYNTDTGTDFKSTTSQTASTKTKRVYFKDNDAAKESVETNESDTSSACASDTKIIETVQQQQYSLAGPSKGATSGSAEAEGATTASSASDEQASGDKSEDSATSSPTSPVREETIKISIRTRYSSISQVEGRLQVDSTEGCVTCDFLDTALDYVTQASRRALKITKEVFKKETHKYDEILEARSAIAGELIGVQIVPNKRVIQKSSLIRIRDYIVPSAPKKPFRRRRLYEFKHKGCVRDQPSSLDVYRYPDVPEESSSESDEPEKPHTGPISKIYQRRAQDYVVLVGDEIVRASGLGSNFIADCIVTVVNRIHERSPEDQKFHRFVCETIHFIDSYLFYYFKSKGCIYIPDIRITGCDEHFNESILKIDAVGEYCVEKIHKYMAKVCNATNAGVQISRIEKFLYSFAENLLGKDFEWLRLLAFIACSGQLALYFVENRKMTWVTVVSHMTISGIFLNCSEGILKNGGWSAFVQFCDSQQININSA